MKTNLLSKLIIIAILFSTIITSCSSKLEPTEANKAIEEYLEENGKVILGFEFTIEQGWGSYKNDFSLNPNQWMAHASKLGLIDLKTNVQNRGNSYYYGTIRAKLSDKAKELAMFMDTTFCCIKEKYSYDNGQKSKLVEEIKIKINGNDVEGELSGWEAYGYMDNGEMVYRSDLISWNGTLKGKRKGKELILKYTYTVEGDEGVEEQTYILEENRIIRKEKPDTHQYYVTDCENNNE